MTGSAAFDADSSTAPAPTMVAIAIVEHAERYLVGTRGPDAPLAGRSEFPGGKCWPGESSRDAAIRECFEETGLVVVPVELLRESTHTYAHGTLRLAFWKCRPANPRDVRANHAGFRWEQAADLANLDFPEANIETIRTLGGQASRPEETL